jgi:hypothetical protein
MSNDDADDPRQQLERILSAPDLARVVPELAPEVIHRVIQHSGLEACREIITLATPEQLTRVFDLDLWRADRPGLDEQFDAERFGEWLEVMLEAGADVVARILADMDTDLVIAGIAQHVRVFDGVVAATFTSLDGELVSTVLPVDTDLRYDLGGYVIVARRTESWPAIVDVLNALETTDRDTFDRVMRGCVNLSNSRPEIDGLDDLLTTGDQAMFDLAVDREQRRDAQGYVTAAEARAFLQDARRVDLGPVASFSESLRSAGPLSSIHAYMQSLPDDEAYSARSGELAFLANTLMAGCSVQSRPFTAEEATNAALAVCNLGLENWPVNPPARERDLVGIFKIGWTVLHEQVCMSAAEHVIATIASLPCRDPSTQIALHTLRVTMTKHWRAGTPWHAREALDVISILDSPAWAALLGLIDELPVLHAAVAASLTGETRPISASAFEFISENKHIAQIRDFLERLPDRLRS